MKEIISEDFLRDAMSYQAYRKLVDDLLEEGKTTGENQSEAMINYAQMGQKRMRKWEKIGKISPELQDKLEGFNSKMTWLVITEGWCGDAGQIVPFVNKMAELNPNIELKFVLRDENLELMDQFLTNGGRSIPILIAIDTESLEVLGTWGPRPEPIQKEFLENKQSQAKSNQEFSEHLHLWYAKDKGASMQTEFLTILDVWSQKLQSSLVQAD